MIETDSPWMSGAVRKSVIVIRFPLVVIYVARIGGHPVFEGIVIEPRRFFQVIW